MSKMEVFKKKEEEEKKDFRGNLEAIKLIEIAIFSVV